MYIKFMNWVGRSALVGLLLGMVACEPPPPPPAPEPTRLFPACQAAAALPAEPLPLKQALTGPLVPGQTAVYTVTMEIDQFLRVEVTEEAMDVHLYLCGPGGEGVDRDSIWVPEVPEELSAVAWEAGKYRLLVHGGSGRFQIRTKALRPATPRDRYRVEAERLSYTALTVWKEGKRVPRFVETMHSAAVLWGYLGDEAREAEALYWVASAEDLPTGDAAEAYRLFERILPVWQAEGPAEREAETLRRLGLHLLDQGTPQEARERFDQAMAAWGQVQDPKTRGVGEGATYQALGRQLYEQGELRLAQTAFRQALVLRKQHASDSVGVTLLSLAPVLHALGEPHKAVDVVDEAINKYGEASSAAYNNRANVLGQMGAFVEAREGFTRALEIVREEGDRGREAVTLNNLAWVREMLDEYDEARKEYREALNISRELGDRDLEATILTSLGRVATDLEEWEEASRLLQEALPLRSGNLRGEAITRHDLAKVQIQKGELSAAEDNLDRALELALETGDRLTEARALSRQGLLAGARGQYSEGLVLSQRALDLVESERGVLPRRDLKAHQTAIRLRFYENHLSLLFDAHRQNPSSGYRAQAFALSDWLRARNLIDLIRESGVDLDQDLDPELRREERDLRWELAEADYRRTTLQAQKANPAQVRKLEREIGELVTGLRQAREAILRANPAYAEQVRPEPLSLGTVQQSILGPGDVLVEYFLGVERGFVWVVTPTTFTMAPLPPRRHIETLVTRYRRALRADIVEERKLGAQLADGLIKPILPALLGKRLIVVPEGALHQLPFSALPIPDAAAAGRSRRLLVDSFEVTSAPSATLIAALRRRDAARATTFLRVAIFADGVYGWDDPRRPATGGANPRGSTGWGPLDDSLQEVAALRALVPEEQRLEALGLSASKEAFLQLSPGEFKIVHVAAHGEVHPQRPELSRLVFSQFSKTGEPVDGDLRFAEIYDLSLRTDLVVLSACETALGQQIRGEGTVGFTRGFLHAGARRVLSSLWKVSDAATAELMRRFYGYHLGEGLPAPTALRQAQRSMRGERAWENPEHWAGFVLHGEWRE